MEGLRRWLAIGVTASLCLTTALNHPALQAGIQQSLADAPKLLPFYLRLIELLEHISLPHLWAFDLFDLAPWQWLNLLGATITFTLYFYNDRVHRIWRLAEGRNPNTAPEDVQIARLLRMVRLRDLCAIFYILLAFGYAFLALKGIDKGLLTGALAPLGVVYGPYL
uniref:Uncharacterized protein n=1 Tax=Candidatus Kentrum sp. SD TaxID=2126332 RepID=A0A450YUA4_9GAMM|nr:MAG: hypothetical protein BECKSD772F_GA0070984_107311 [Candidatus Kentron sp. SD]VFK45049.1 MAG: hypothetical protein BECKSD772E_GA0070983_104711 [Candidatus Kentron sp. SD]VFK78689.1 MAG: hypothetical protein BECKSD772D_GA0070982_102210 [Candidatus Kentron sp. SD]